MLAVLLWLVAVTADAVVPFLARVLAIAPNQVTLTPAERAGVAAEPIIVRIDDSASGRHRARQSRAGVVSIRRPGRMRRRSARA
ncbi:hypothetical protein CKO23_19855 [Thiocystis violacea]|nr:hypothetical protein [Thiocystis violacea]